MKYKKCITITNAFQKVLDECRHKPNKIWEDEGSEFHKKSLKTWLQNNYIEMYSTHNKRKCCYLKIYYNLTNK